CPEPGGAPSVSSGPPVETSTPCGELPAAGRRLPDGDRRRRGRLRLPVIALSPAVSPAVVPGAAGAEAATPGWSAVAGSAVALLAVASSAERDVVSSPPAPPGAEFEVVSLRRGESARDDRLGGGASSDAPVVVVSIPAAVDPASSWDGTEA